MTTPVTEKQASPSNHYVNNAEFLKALADYKIAAEEAKAQGKEEPRVPEYIGECFLKIATHLSYKHNFISYSYKEEMIGDAVIDCLKYFRNFDPNKSKNPFSYFTQYCFNAFVRRILREKKQQTLKKSLISNMNLEDLFYSDDSEHGQQMLDYLKSMVDEEDDKPKVPKAKKGGKKVAQLSEDAFDPD